MTEKKWYRHAASGRCPPVGDPRCEGASDLPVCCACVLGAPCRPSSCFRSGCCCPVRAYQRSASRSAASPRSTGTAWSPTRRTACSTERRGLSTTRTVQLDTHGAGTRAPRHLPTFALTLTLLLASLAPSRCVAGAADRALSPPAAGGRHRARPDVEPRVAPARGSAPRPGRRPRHERAGA